jgi:hypothetical protein
MCVCMCLVYIYMLPICMLCTFVVIHKWFRQNCTVTLCKACVGSRGVSPLLLNLGARWNWPVSRPVRCIPGKEPRYQLNFTLSWPQSLCARVWVWDSLLRPGFELRSVQPVADVTCSELISWYRTVQKTGDRSVEGDMPRYRTTVYLW